MSSTEQPFSLEPAPSAGRHGRQLFSRPLAFYVPIYDTEIRQLKNWVKKGRPAEAGKPSDLPPLDEPAKMREWWTRHYPDRAVPQKILLSVDRMAAAHGQSPGNGALPAQKFESTQTSESKKQAPGKDSEGEAPASYRNYAVDMAEVTPMSLAEAVKRQHKTLAVLQEQLDRALQDPKTDESTLNMVSGRVDRCLERLRKLQDTLSKEERANGNLVARDDLRVVLTPVFAALADSLVQEVVTRLGHPRPAALQFVDEWFSQIRGNRFLTATMPPALAA